ncbi:MAG: molybdopterin molybdotransferase MoeA [Saprospiraceae bacterium]|nr:molybdopterin molybdotransferase MoeA [Saprospiraceae bacterium]
MRPLSSENCLLIEAVGKFLAQDVYAEIDVPSFDNSAMDGYAFCYDASLKSYKIVGSIAAGSHLKIALNKGETAQIFTGAPLPEHADTVIAVEQVSASGGVIQFDPDVVFKGMHVRNKASQNSKGDCIAKKGTRVGHGLIALLASCGIKHIEVYRQPVVDCIITGSELQDLGSTLSDDNIYNSNGPAIHAFLLQCGIKIQNTLAAKDEKKILRDILDNSLQKSDLLIITGGVSAGAYDFVPEVLEEIGVIKLFHKVKQKPGKPIYCGIKEHRWIFGLPGNPASVLACLNQYIKPCISGLSGDPHMFNKYVFLPAKNSWKKKSGLSHILKAKIEENQVAILEGQESFNLLPFNQCNAFVVLEEDVDIVEKGDLVKAYFE